MYITFAQVRSFHPWLFMYQAFIFCHFVSKVLQRKASSPEMENTFFQAQHFHRLFYWVTSSIQHSENMQFPIMHCIIITSKSIILFSAWLLITRKLLDIFSGLNPNNHLAADSFKICSCGCQYNMIYSAINALLYKHIKVHIVFGLTTYNQKTFVIIKVVLILITTWHSFYFINIVIVRIMF